ncbi:divergent protein kinase domain 1B-like [Glandiceps talaboti]
MRRIPEWKRIGVVLLTFYLVIFILDYEEKCGEHHLIYTCALYKQYKVSGTLCSQLCDDNFFRTSKKQCLSIGVAKQVIQYLDWPVGLVDSLVVKFQTSWYKDYQNNQGTVDLINTARNQCLHETSSHRLCEQYTDSIIVQADTNNDGYVDEIEAVTMAILLRNREFVMLTMLDQSNIVTKLLGYCGGMYAVENVDSTVDQVFGTADHILDVFPMEGLDLIISIIPETTIRKFDPLAKYFYSLFIQKYIPVTEDKNWLTNQIFELLNNIVDFQGTRFHLCDIHWANFGIIKRGFEKVLVILDSDDLYPSNIVSEKLQTIKCEDHDDCHLGDHLDCVSSCNYNLGTCQAKLTKQDLNILCWNLLHTVWVPGFAGDNIDEMFPLARVHELLRACNQLPMYANSTAYRQQGLRTVQTIFQQITGYYK